MKIIILTVLVATLIVPAAQGAIGSVTPAVIYGDGSIVNGDWNLDWNQSADIELALRARQRGTNVVNINPADGQYYYSAGSVGGFALWDFEFAANVGTRNLQDVRIDLWIDVNPGPDETVGGVTYLALEDIFNPSVPAWSAPISNLNAAAWGEHEVGTAATGAGGGLLFTSETGANPLSIYSVVQNAENMGEVINGFDPNSQGTYDFKLTAVDRNNPDVKLEAAWMRVHNNAVPEPASFAIFLLLPVFGIVFGWRQWSKTA